LARKSSKTYSPSVFHFFMLAGPSAVAASLGPAEDFNRIVCLLKLPSAEATSIMFAEGVIPFETCAVRHAVRRLHWAQGARPVYTVEVLPRLLTA
ncbi:MAG: hypothetical protein ACTS6A_02915, partial [Candidatus Hodgkinia cicadicola]